jgi:D-lactate dehydrogenase
MRTAVFSARPYEREFFDAAVADAGGAHELRYLESRLTAQTAALADGCDAACLFVNDRADAGALASLAAGGVRLLALRSAGFNHVDLEAAARLGLTVARVPAYSPHAVAEHAVALLLALVRRLPRAYNRVREGNFALDGLLGFDLFGKSVGVVGTGEIGTAFARIMLGFGCRVIATDPAPSDACRQLGVEYVALPELLESSDVVALHCPLTPATRHLLDAAAFDRMRGGVVVVNTSRGAVVDTRAAIGALKAGRLGGLGLDVYEEEADLFFTDRSAEVIRDDVFARLLTFPNVIVTGHQAFFTREALANIAATTVGNLTTFERGTGTLHRVPPPPPASV